VRVCACACEKMFVQETLLPARLRAALCEIIIHRYIDVDPHTDICELRQLCVYSEIDTCADLSLNPKH
jgi:hypothetical protein